MLKFRLAAEPALRSIRVRAVRRLLAFFRNEWGAVSVITLAGILALSGFFALSVDAGSMYLAKKRLQKAVDLAALKAVTDPSNAGKLAQSVVEGNVTADRLADSVSVMQGRYPPTGYTTSDLASLAPNARFEAGAAQPNALRIMATSTVSLFLSRLFFSGDPIIAAQATAYNEPLVQLTVGSGTLTVDTSQSVANDALLSGLLGTSVTLSAAGYQGLVNAHVRFFEVLDALVSITGTPSGDYGALLAASVSYGEVVDALIAAVNADPDLAGDAAGLAASLGAIRGQVGGAGSMTLGDILSLDAEGAVHAVGSRLNVFAFLRTSAEAANSNNGILSPVDLAIDGGTVKARIAVVQPTRISVVGGEGIFVTSGRIRLYLEVNPTATLSLLGNIVSVRLPVLFESVPGQATVADLACNGPDAANARVDVAAQAGTITVQTADIDTTSLHQGSPLATQAGEIAYAAGLVRVTASGSRSFSGNAQTLTFNGSFHPANTQRVSLSSPVQNVVVSLVADNSYNVEILGPPLLLSTSLVMDQLMPILNAIAPTVDVLLDDLLEAMGMAVGYTDVTVPYVRCSNPVLAQ